MKKISWLGLIWVTTALFTFARPAQGAFVVGAQVHPLNFFILPSGTGLSTNGKFGTGAVFAGVSASTYFDLQAYLSSDNTGTFHGTGTLFGSTGTFDGKFKVLSYGVEMKLAPPAFPLYFKLGAGLCDLTSDVTYTVAGVPAGNPFGTFEASFEGHFGLGFAFKLSAIRIHAGLDSVLVKLKSNAQTTAAGVSAFVYFRPNVGLSLFL